MSDSSRPLFVIDAWSFTEEQPRPQQDYSRLLPGTWYHCQRDQAGLYEWLQASGIQTDIIDALLTEDTRCRFQKLGKESFLLILRGVNKNHGAEPDDMLSLRMLYHNGSLISMRRHSFAGVALLREALTRGEGPQDIPDVVTTIIEEMHVRVEDVLDGIEAFVDDIESKADSMSKQDQAGMMLKHRHLLKLNRYLRPQTAALDAFAQAHLESFAPVSQRLHNQKDTAQRFTETIEAYLEQVWMLREHSQQALGEKMNRNTYWLSVIAGIFLPLGFLTGLLGVNIGGMPGTENPEAFIWFCYGLISLSAVEFLILRRLRFW